MSNGRDAWLADSRKKIKRINVYEHKIKIIGKERLNRKMKYWDLDKRKEGMLERQSLGTYRQWEKEIREVDFL